MTLEPQSFVVAKAIQEAMRYYDAGRLSDAEIVCNRVLESKPDDANAIYLLAEISHQRGNFDHAVEMFERAITLKPANPFFLNNLGEILRELDRPADAESLYRRALALKPDFIKAHNNLGNALQSLGHYDEAERCYIEANRLDPALAFPRLNRGLLKLLRGEYGLGFELYEHRFEGAATQQKAFFRHILGKLKDVPRWRGEPLQGKRILVWAEQGLGDSIMMARYLPLLASRGAGFVMVSCATALVGLMRTIDGVGDAVSWEDDWTGEHLDVHFPLMSLPLLFGTTLDTVPATVPYVRVADEIRRKWQFRMSAISHPRVGLVWAGGKRTVTEARRSMQFQDFAPFLAAGGAGFVSLQKGADSADPARRQWSIADFMEDCDDFLDTAGIVEQLDLVISVDTSVAHLAGALGRPVWVVTQGAGAWQWMLERDDTPWYPTMRIFRRLHCEDWHDLMARIATEFKSTYGLAVGGISADMGCAPPHAKKPSWMDLLLRRWE